MMTVEMIRKAIENTNFEVYGVRVDEIVYKNGDIAEKSHLLYYDPIFDEDGELVYEENEYGMFDGGELDGTCAITFDPEDEESILRALDMIQIYRWNDSVRNIHLLGAEYATRGEDEGEEVMEDAVVLLSEAA